MERWIERPLRNLQRLAGDLLDALTDRPAVHRLEWRGWIKAEWGASDNNRKAKYYGLTRAGQKQLTAETGDWARLTAAVNLIIGME